MRTKRWMIVCMAAGLALSARADLVHRYTFSDNVNDVVGTANGTASTNGVYIEAPLYVEDTPTGATGPTKSLEVGMNVGTKKSGFTLTPDVGLAQTGSYSLWLKADQVLAGRYALHFSTPGLILLQNNNSLQFAIGVTADVKQTVTTPFTVGEWVHVAMSWDIPNGTAAAYVNGSQVWSSTTIASTINMAGGARIGNYGVPTLDNNSNLALQFDGHLYDMQVYDKVLTSADVTWLNSNPGSVIPEPATVGMLGLGAVLAILVRHVPR